MAAAPRDWSSWAVPSSVRRPPGEGFGGRVLDTRQGRASIWTCRHDHLNRYDAIACARAYITPPGALPAPVGGTRAPEPEQPAFALPVG